MSRPPMSTGYVHRIWHIRPEEGGGEVLIADFVGDADWYLRGDPAETAAERYLLASYGNRPQWTPGWYRVVVTDALSHRSIVTIERALPRCGGAHPRSERARHGT